MQSRPPSIAMETIGMDTIGMDSYPFIAHAAAAVIGGRRRREDRVLPVVGSGGKGNPPPRAAFGSPDVVRQTTVSMNAVLRTPVRRAIIGFIAHPLPSETTPAIPPPETCP